MCISVMTFFFFFLRERTFLASFGRKKYIGKRKKRKIKDIYSYQAELAAFLWPFPSTPYKGII